MTSVTGCKLFTFHLNQAQVKLISVVSIYDASCLSKTLLASHMRNVHDPSPDNVCEICGRTFKHNISLQNHKKIEHSTTPPVKAQCDICGTW